MLRRASQPDRRSHFDIESVELKAKIGDVMTILKIGPKLSQSFHGMLGITALRTRQRGRSLVAVEREDVWEISVWFGIVA